MSLSLPDRASFTDADLEFVVEETVPGAQNKQQLRQLVLKDGDFRKAMVGDDRVFQRVMSDDKIFVKISPPLYFEILLRRALKDLSMATHTVERSGRQGIPVFDTKEVSDLLESPGVLEYLGDMLASFTRVQSYTVPVRVRRGVRRRVRYSDMDIDGLLRLCSNTDEPHRFNYYKRIADVCLFMSGVFPGHASRPASRRSARPRRTMDDYEGVGRRFYGLAAAHPTARTLSLADVFDLLRQHFASARKPLTFIVSQYLHSRKHHLFGVEA